MATKNKKVYTPEPEKTGVIAEVISLFEKYRDTTGAILDDYVVGNDGMFTELAAADDNLRQAFESIETGGEPETEMEETTLEDFAESSVVDFCVRNGYAVIKVDGAQREKLKDFIESYAATWNLGLGIETYGTTERVS